MRERTPLTQYILDQAQKANDEGLSETDFFEQWSARIAAQTPERNESSAVAIAALVAEGAWPWKE